MATCSVPQFRPSPACNCNARSRRPTLQDYFELGVILLRKKLYTQATKNLEKALKAWQGEPEELAQVGSWQWHWPSWWRL